MMKADFKRYDVYKKSDSLWIDEVPIHWLSGRVKDFVDTNPITKIPSDMTEDDLVEFIPMTNVNDELGQIKKFNYVILKEVSTGYTKFKNGDVIFAKITPCMENGNCAIVSGLTHNICFGSTEFMVFRPFRKLTAKYLHYFLHNDTFRRNAEPFMKGTAGQKRITSHHMATHFFALPPTKEQQIITTYLDTKTAQIDRKIDLLSQKVTQYGKLKQSLINETVTHGLDKTVPMKDSGVEWIAEVPEHWEVRRVKELGNLVLGKMLDNEESENTFYRNYLKSKNIGWLNIEAANIEKMYFSVTEMKNYRLKKDDILLSEGGEVGKTSFWNDEIEECYIQNSVHKITVYKNNSPRFLLYQSFLLGSIKYYDSIVSYVSIKHLTKEKLSRVNWVRPPLAEQQAIAAYLDEKTANINRIVATINTQIDKLKELRKALINDVVTGKIRVA